MSYININVDIDIDDIIDSMSYSEKKMILHEIESKDILKEIKDRHLTPSKGVEISNFSILTNYQKREALIKLLDLPSYANDTEILKAVKDSI